MLLALHAFDFGLIGLFLLSVLAVGAFFAQQHRTVTDYCAGNRSVPWIAAGISAAVTLLAAHLFICVPGTVYDVGLKALLAPIGVCLAASIAVFIVMPLMSRLDVLSIYEYLEFRFGPVTRWVVAGTWILWRLIWLAVVVGVPCRTLGLVCGGAPPTWLWIVIVGLVATAYTSFGGLKAVVWTDVLQALAIVVALLALVGAFWWSLDDGSATVWQVAKEYGRSQVADLNFSWSESWSFFSALPLFVLLMLAMSTIDQTVIQRLLAARDTRCCQRGYLVGAAGLALLLATLTYAGVGLFAFCQKHHNSLRPVWVVNLDNRMDNQTRRSLTFADRDRLWPEMSDDPQSEETDGGSSDLRKPSTAADANQPLVAWDTDLRHLPTLERLVAERRILRPNNKRPFENVDELVDLETDELIVDQLAMKRTDGEIILHARAREELLPHFVANGLGLGAMGLVVVGILAVSMASFDSGIHSLATVILVDFHRRGGIGRSWLAGLLKKPADRLTESDELKMVRPLTAAVGLLAFLLALLVGQNNSSVWLLGAFTIAVAGPLLAVFALGILTRSATKMGVLAGLAVGFTVNVWLVFGPAFAQHLGGLAWLWRGKPLAWGWVMMLGVAVTCVVSLLLSLFLGRRKTKQQLRGLVLGVGKLGEREVLHEAISVPGEEDPANDDPRWRR